MRRIISCSWRACDRRLLLAAFGVCLSLAGAGRALAQRVIVEPVRPPLVVLPPPVALPPGIAAPGLGGGVLQQLPPAPKIDVQPSAPVAAPPARVVRFRCELTPQEEACREPGSADGGGDGECNCARDYCYWNDQGRHVCEKLQ